MAAYYNEFDEYAAQWLRNLIAAGHIADGDVDQRSINAVSADDLANYTQCHFFAGIGVWSHALRLAGWDDDRPVWTGSCPCQPFSAAGKGDGFDDERHLWPSWFHLIGERKPPVIFGEQVESAIKHGWLDLVQTDLEGIGYAFAAAGIPAAGVGAPHIRQRLYWLADSQSYGRQRTGEFRESSRGHGATYGGPIGRMDNAHNTGLEGFGGGHKTEGWGPGQVRPASPASESCRVEHATGDGREQWGTESGRGSVAAGRSLSGLADAVDSTGHGSQPRGIIRELPQGVGAMQTECRPTGPVNGRWPDADWLFCRDGKWRPVEPGTFPLVNGASARVGRLRAYGNAIVPQVAQAFIEAFLEVRP